MKHHHLLLGISLIGVIAMVMSARAETLSVKDFVENASIANEFEIESSKLALDKSENSEVKEFAQRMVDDHTKTGDKLKKVLASSDSGAQPADALDNKHQMLMDKLKSAAKDNFDSEYISIQTDAHEEAVRLFSDYSTNGKDMKLKEFASDTLPTLKEHLQHVKKIKVK